MAQCRNCMSPLEGPYCAVCGQKDIDLERPLRELIGEITRETFDLDGRAWLTAKTLFLRPGLLTKEFLAGKRQSYTPPLRLYLFISVAFFVLMAWVASQGLMLEQGQLSDLDAAVQARFMSDELPRLMFVLLPVFAVFLKALFWRRLYFDHLIYSVHFHSAAYVVLALMLPAEKVSGDSLPALALQVVLLTYLIAYLVISLRRVYATTLIGASAKAAALFLAYSAVISGVIEAVSSFQIISD